MPERLQAFRFELRPDGAQRRVMARTAWANPWLFHGFSLLDELDRYVEIGLTPREALHSATVAPARFLALADQDGRIAAGRRADLVLLDGDPLEDLSVLRSPRAVIAHGRLFDETALEAIRDALLAAAVAE